MILIDAGVGFRARYAHLTNQLAFVRSLLSWLNLP